MAKENDNKDRTIEVLQEENERLRTTLISLTKKISAQEIIQEVARDISSELELVPLLQKILASAIEVMEAKAGSLLLHDSATDQLVFEVVHSEHDGELKNTSMNKDAGIAGWVFTQGKPLIVDDVKKDDRFYKDIDESSGFQTTNMIAIPLRTRGSVIGVLEVLNKVSGEPFDNDDIDILTILAAQSATAIQNAQLLHSVRQERDRILGIEADVKRNLSRDLHDGPAQIIAGIVMNAGFIRKLLRKDPQMAEKELIEIEKMAKRASHQVRTLMFELRPLVLESQGLAPALEFYAQRLREDGKLKWDSKETSIEVITEGPERRLEPKAEALVFSVLQEALGNTTKHAKAENVWIKIVNREDKTIASIEDDGRGFDVNEVMASYGTRGSLGMINMKERAEMIDAEFTITSEKDKGTLIKLEIPYNAT